MKNEEECVCWLGWKAGWKLVEISKQLPSLRGYHPVIIQLSFSYYLVSLSYSMVTFCANSFRLTEACSCTILLSINNSRSGQEHAYTSGCTAHCPWKCKRIFFLSPRPKIFQTHHSLTKNSYVHWLKTSNPYNSFLPSS